MSAFRRGGKGKWIEKYTPRKGKPVAKRFGNRKHAALWKAKMIAADADSEFATEDVFEGPMTDPIGKHLESYRVAMQSRGTTDKHQNDVFRAIDSLLVFSEARTLKGLSRDSFDGWIAELRGLGKSQKTIHNYVFGVKTWVKWLVETKRLREDFATGVKIKRTDAGRVRLRRAFSVDELIQLIEGAPQRSVQRYAETHPGATTKTLEVFRQAGERRGMAYKLGALTGLRLEEMRALCWADIKPHRDNAGVERWFLEVTPQTSKSRKRVQLPIGDELATALQEWRVTNSGQIGRPVRARDPVICMKKGGSIAPGVIRHLVRMLYLDAKFLGIPRVDETGRTIDVHALRYTFASLLILQGVHLFEVQKLMRHAKVETTVQVYIDLGLEHLLDRSKHISLTPILTPTETLFDRNAPVEGATRNPEQRRG